MQGRGPGVNLRGVPWCALPFALPWSGRRPLLCALPCAPRPNARLRSGGRRLVSPGGRAPRVRPCFAARASRPGRRLGPRGDGGAVCAYAGPQHARMLRCGACSSSLSSAVGGLRLRALLRTDQWQSPVAAILRHACRGGSCESLRVQIRRPGLRRTYRRVCLYELSLSFACRALFVSSSKFACHPRSWPRSLRPIGLRCFLERPRT